MCCSGPDARIYTLRRNDFPDQRCEVAPCCNNGDKGIPLERNASDSCGKLNNTVMGLTWCFSTPLESQRESTPSDLGYPSYQSHAPWTRLVFVTVFAASLIVCSGCSQLLPRYDRLIKRRKPTPCTTRHFRTNSQQRR